MDNTFLQNAYIHFIKLSKLDITTPYNKTDDIHIIGFFDISQHMWYHAWAMTLSIHKESYYKKSKELLKYALDMDINKNGISVSEIPIIKSMLVNSKFYISEKRTQLDIIIALITYLLKAKRYYIEKDNNFVIYYIEI
jgi:hypothetical protein